MAEEFVELVVDGPRGWDIGFVRGFLAGRGLEAPILQAEEEGFACESFAEKAREVFQPGRERMHLLVPRGASALVKEAVTESAARGQAMAVRSERPLAGARFRFFARIFSRVHGERIRRLLTELPEGARAMTGSRWEEREDPDAKGEELYAPVHEYELKGEGAVEGELLAVLDVYRRCREEELIRVERAELIGA